MGNDAVTKVSVGAGFDKTGFIINLDLIVQLFSPFFGKEVEKRNFIV